MEGLALGTVLLVAIAAFLLLFLLWAVPVGLWITAFASGVRVKLPSLIGMRFRKVDPRG
ncbi:MAG: flotillin-like FloA family protein, partial [Acidobacteria bacterium]|nr:flotillin-like FloA family protein [Acidobacteriota bacterium]